MTKQELEELFSNTEYSLRSVKTTTTDISLDIDALKNLANEETYDEYVGDADVSSMLSYTKDGVIQLRTLFAELSGLQLDNLDYTDFLDTLNLFISNRNDFIAKSILHEITSNNKCIDKVNELIGSDDIDKDALIDEMCTLIFEDFTMEDVVETYFMERCLIDGINIDFPDGTNFHDTFIHTLTDFTDDDILEFTEMRELLFSAMDAEFFILQ